MARKKTKCIPFPFKRNLLICHFLKYYKYQFKSDLNNHISNVIKYKKKSFKYLFKSHQKNARKKEENYTYLILNVKSNFNLIKIRVSFQIFPRSRWKILQWAR